MPLTKATCPNPECRWRFETAVGAGIDSALCPRCRTKFPIPGSGEAEGRTASGGGFAAPECDEPPDESALEAAEDKFECLCDVCSGPAERATSYVLTTRQVVSSESYWIQALQDPLMAFIHDLSPQGAHLVLATQGLVGSPTAWLVCEKCIGLFEVDRETARRYSLENARPPELGPAPPEVAALPLGYAWARLYHSWPTSVRVGHHAALSASPRGSACDFCGRVVGEGDEDVALIKGDEFLKHFEEVADIACTRPSSRTDADGAPLHFACGLCVRRYLQSCKKLCRDDPQQFEEAVRRLKTR